MNTSTLLAIDNRQQWTASVTVTTSSIYDWLQLSINQSISLFIVSLICMNIVVAATASVAHSGA